MEVEKRISIEELLKPRIIVENNYPRSPFKHHEIICEPSAQQVEWAKEFTVNFRFLKWWEHREESDMPRYVKRKGISERVYDVSNATEKYPDSFMFDNPMTEHWVAYTDCIPISESEYLTLNK